MLGTIYQGLKLCPQNALIILADYYKIVIPGKGKKKEGFVMKIVILDAFAVVNGGLSLDKIAALGDLTYYDRTPAELTIERIGDAEAVYTNKVKLTEEIFAACPSVKFVGVLATGYDIIDLDAARKRGIVVTNIPGYATMSVAQSVFALLLEITNRVAVHSDAVLQGEWAKSPDFCFILTPLAELEGKTIGIVGYGKIGMAVEKIAKAFGMKVIVHSSHKEDSVTLDTLLKEADIVTLHTPLTDKNRGFWDKSAFGKMKKGAILINTSRGGLVNDKDLADALNSGHFAGAGLDVVSKEPMDADSPLLDAKNIYITPHIAWASVEARERLLAIAAGNLQAFIAGEPVNKVS